MRTRNSWWTGLLVAFLAIGAAVAILPACGDDGGNDSRLIGAQ